MAPGILFSSSGMEMLPVREMRETWGGRNVRGKQELEFVNVLTSFDENLESWVVFQENTN